MSKPQRLPSGRWRIRWGDHAGKRCSETFAKEAAARTALRQRQADADDIRAGKVAPPMPTSPTFGAFVRERWLPTYPASVGNRALTVAEKERHVRHNLLPHLGAVPLDRVRGEVVDQLFAALFGAGLAAKTVKNIRATLMTILRSAKKWKVIGDVPELPPVKVPDAAWDFLASDETERLFAAAVDERERALLVFAAHTGARWGEQRAITWGDLDWKSGQVVIRKSMPHNTDEVAPTKSGRARRVPMTATLRTALLAIRDLNHLAGGLVFGRRMDGGALSLYGARERLQRACRKAGIREVRWHDLRHSFASQLVSAGVPLRQVQEWLGHSTITMTMRYSHLAPGSGDAIRALDPGWTQGGHERRGV